MAGHTVTIELPDDLYDRLQRQAAEARRSIAAEVVQVLAMAVPVMDNHVPTDLEKELAHLETLDDASLWKIARPRFPTRTAKRMQALQFKRQREGLSDDERQLEAVLAQEYDRRMLVRSKALLLLKQRGHDVTELVSRP